MTTPRLLSERYELGDPLGYGGMSEVHRGLDTRLGRDVAVKVLRADLARDPQFQLRFRREAQNSASLNHPAIVAVYDTGEIESEFGPLPYIVMEFVDGQTLREIVKTTGPLSQQRVVEVMADVCAALDFSHRHGIIHRDVKPANVMINGVGAVKVMDFGIARALGEGQNVTQTAAVIGTAQYLSPEQARGESVDARSDVYAAGCVLFELLTGEPPFTGDTPVAVAYQHVREDPRAPSELNPSVPPALDAVVLKALSKNPANRYQSAAEMRADLVRVRNGEPVHAPLVMSEYERTQMMAHDDATTAMPTRRMAGNGAGGPPTGRHVMPPDHDGYDDDSGRGRGKKIALWLVGLIVLGLLGFVGFQMFSNSSPDQVSVPDVLGQTPEQARSTISAVGLLPDQQNQPSDVAQIGKVVRTDPGGGNQVAENSRVTVFVGTGPAEVTVPSLVGSSPSDAEVQLREAGLQVGGTTEQETSDSSQIGKIIRTDPGPGQRVPGNTSVALVVGKEQTTVSVPDVTGQSAEQAANTLRGAGFTSVSTTEVDGGGSAGSVVGTDPAAGTRVQKDRAISIQVSRGNQSQIPNVVGQRVDNAVNTLREAGLSFQIQTVDVSDSSQNGIVLNQSPSGGSQASDGQSVSLTVGRASGSGNDGGDSTDETGSSGFPFN
ncbi:MULTISPECIES: Stk1 family PASTA domain-containing Ser/Thr kinase [unclassified Pseudonocardia]|uniref:Stk1 family PASTA domain-containing Ser/Thr kinase n=1 Tax=unclassified Pseudonocardia TaxID=2619320 RepID=UPI0001FFEFE9|nr:MULTISPECIES: Stk1 family PASTA domain-containing Ser/Thr kinase [unclassified Pseudonocardia]ALE75487.1 serine/threonine protein kinase [Pseudonocardia sp. EC080625-04]ALL74861.1 serine/threonine protein kinase [Pseudonocardia sp. EC080610-09]ALL81884.1 serine/threonine protein kinase [Pseudonocardia sp. EC080619-01]OLM15752.1 Serine/threonine protein kinase PrkC, regulator of stationary phase [Pseudonocardia sp. Ae707_Ps1]OLM21561.1 Serine/threonine protein kinase PrkC, regulator of stati